jgi:hypothetical protein
LIKYLLFFVLNRIINKFILNVKNLIIMKRSRPMARRAGFGSGRHYGEGGKTK